MPGAPVFIDPSQFPENVRRDLLASLLARAINHKFHYDTYQQAARWLALHEAHSPARQDASCLKIYDDAFHAAAQTIGTENIHLIGLGCGGGQKEARLMELLPAAPRRIIYTPCDVSLPLVLTARSAALARLEAENCHGVVCDLATTDDLATALDQADSTSCRLVTLFGIVPNFEPAPLLFRLRTWLRPGDHLLLSANLAPGTDYAAGVGAVLPQYDNPLTREWLLTLLLDLGFEADDGRLHFEIADDEQGLKRITAHYELQRPRTIRVYGESLAFGAGERIRLFFSYRHTVATMSALLQQAGLEVAQTWVNDAGEEGVFLCQRRG